MIEPIRIEERVLQTLYGRKMRTQLTRFNPTPLWQAFRGDLAKEGSNEQPRFYSVQVYDGGLQLDTFSAETPFDYWVAIESAPNEAKHETLEVRAGAYAVFQFEGDQRHFSDFLQGIYRVWLPHSGYVLDDRPCFEVLDHRYKGPSNPESLEEVFIPIKQAR